MAELRHETEANSSYIREEGYTLVKMTECEWRRLKKRNPEITEFLRTKFDRHLDNLLTMSTEQILSAILDETLFGMIECDIHVPVHLKEHFSEMTPIFKNVEISRDDIGPYMKQFAEDHDIMSRPRRSLIGSYFGEKILLATPLVKWYLQHGLEVTRIYQVVEYTPNACFHSFGEAVSNARREGDSNPDFAIKGDTMKLVSIFMVERGTS